MSDPSLIEHVRDVARDVSGAADLDPLVDRLAGARVGLLGEASHGTSEYYEWRHRLSRRLIEEHDFSFIAVEGDWPDCYAVNRYVRAAEGAGTDARSVLHEFSRWPTWMWANREVVDLVQWLRGHNDALPPDERAGFYGLDVYSLWESMDAVLDYLDRTDADAAERARAAYGCFDRYEGDVQEYARATRFVPASCEEEVVGILRELQQERARLAREQARDGVREASFDAEQNALVARNAEHYYRIMGRGGPDSWNLRDTHMMETLERLLEHHGPDAKGIVWEHNTHVGDARATDMAAAGLLNVGQLARERWGDGAVLVGFASHSGTVIAGRWWGAPMERMPVPEARPGSWEDVLHQAVGSDVLVLSDDLTSGAASSGSTGSGRGPVDVEQRRAHRAIGVVYNPTQERYGNYVPTNLPARYDALLYLDRTRAVDPLHMQARHDGEPPETFPSGM